MDRLPVGCTRACTIQEGPGSPRPASKHTARCLHFPYNLTVRVFKFLRRYRWLAISLAFLIAWATLALLRPGMWRKEVRTVEVKVGRKYDYMEFNGTLDVLDSKYLIGKQWSRPVLLDLEGNIKWVADDDAGWAKVVPGPGANTVCNYFHDLDRDKGIAKLRDIDGQVLWEREFKAQVKRSPEVSVNSEAVLLLDDDGRLEAVNRYGAQMWTLQLDPKSRIGSPCLPDGSCIVLQSQAVLRVSNSGLVVWSTPLAHAATERPIILENWIAALDYSGSGVSLDFQGGITGRFVALTRSNRCCFASQGDTLLCQSVSDGRLYACRNGGTQTLVGSGYYCIWGSEYDPDSGNIYLTDWYSPDSARLTGMQVLEKKLGRYPRRREEYSRLICLDKNQSRCWSVRFDEHLISAPVIAPDGLVYVGWGKTYLKAFKP